MSNVRTVKRDRDGNELPATSPIYLDAKRAFPNWWWDQEPCGAVVTTFGFAGQLRLRVSGSGVTAEIDYGFGDNKTKIKHAWAVHVGDAVRRVFELLVDDTARSMGLSYVPRHRAPSSPLTIPTAGSFEE